MGALATFIGFQAAWFACVPGAAHGYALVGPLVGSAWLALFLWKSPRPQAVARLALFCVAIGLGLDTFLIWIGAIAPVRFLLPPPFLPLWLITLWAIMPTLIFGNLAWLFRRYRLASLLGAFGGPLAYWGGFRIGALSFGDPQLRSLLILALGWAFAFPLMIFMASHWSHPKPAKNKTPPGQ